jgi:hypothetical protein
MRDLIEQGRFSDLTVTEGRRFAAAKRVALLALVASLSGYGCDHSGYIATDGRIEVALALPGGVTVSSVAWKVLSSASVVLASGTVNTNDPKATPSVDVSVPTGTNDTVTMTTTTSQGVSCSGTSAPFNVTSGQPVPVPVTITCGNVTTDGGSPGSVVITGTVVPGDSCPVLSSWQISPQMTSASGGQIDVSAIASDADSGDTLTFAWSATAGSFLAASSATTKYVCNAAGTQTLTVAISDNHSPTPCTINVSFPVVDCL